MQKFSISYGPESNRTEVVLYGYKNSMKLLAQLDEEGKKNIRLEALDDGGDVVLE